MTQEAHVRIGEYVYKLAEGYYEDTGLRPMRRLWRSIFAERQGTPGSPGIQNVRETDLRWMLENFHGGHGQRVLQPEDALGELRYYWSQGVDLSIPGEIRLAKALVRQGLTGAGGTTLEGDGWQDVTGTSTVIGTDRRLNEIGDRIRSPQFQLTAGNWQVDIFAYVEENPLVLGKDLLKKAGKTSTLGDRIVLQDPGTVVQTVAQDPTDGSKVSVRFKVSAQRLANDASARFTMFVQNTTDNKTVASVEVILKVDAQNPDQDKSRTLVYTAKAGKTYRYRIRLESKNGFIRTMADEITWGEDSPKNLEWDIRRDATLVASGVVDLSGTTATRPVASATIAVTSTGDYRIRVRRGSGEEVRIILDKAVYEEIDLRDPRVIELGLNNRIWLVDYAATGLGPSVLYWERETSSWQAVATIGGTGDLAVAATHTDSYEFVALDDKVVYRVKPPSTGEAYTAATTDPIVGVTVAGNRLLVLTESPANGTELFEGELEGTPPVALTTKYAVGTKGVLSEDIPQRMAPTEGGAVFFVNQGPDCWVYRWDGSAGAPLRKLTPGFRGDAIVHGNGYTWVGGGFPSVGPDGDLRMRPAILVVDADGGTELLDVKLFDEKDEHGRIRALQLYGTDLWVVTEAEFLQAAAPDLGVSGSLETSVLLATGFEHGVYSHEAVGDAVFSTSADAGSPTVVAAAARTGSYGLRVAPTASTAERAGREFVSGVFRLGFRGYVKLSGVSGTGFREVVGFSFQSGPSPAIGIDNADGKWYAKVGASSQPGPVFKRNAWVRVEVFLEAAAGPTFTLKWSIDGVEQADIVTADSSSYLRFILWGSGGTSGTAYTGYLDDLLLLGTGGTGTEGLYPIGHGHSEFLRPNGMGSHLSEGSFRDDTSGAIDADSYDRVDDVVPLSSSADFLEQYVAGATSYVELEFEDLAAGLVPQGLSMVAVLNADAAGSSDVEVKSADGAVETSVRSSAVGGTGLVYAQGSAGVTYQRATPWTGADVNALKARFGYAADVDPVPRLQALGLEVDVFDSVATVEEVRSAARLWRVSLRAPIAAFLHHQISTDQTQTAGRARGLAVTWEEKFLIWSKGSPYREGEDYLTSGENYLESSLYNFGLTEEKRLLLINVEGLFPALTSAEILYTVDDGETWASAGEVSSSRRLPLFDPALFLRLGLRIYPRTADPGATPVVHSVMAQGWLQAYDKAWELLLDCSDDSAVYRVGSQAGMRRGSEGFDNIFTLADEGGFVEFEDNYSHGRQAQVHLVQVETPDASYIKRAEGILRVRLKEPL